MESGRVKLRISGEKRLKQSILVSVNRYLVQNLDEYLT